MKSHDLLASLASLHQVLAIGGYQPTAATAQFKEPPTKYRPKFRYWLPDASVSESAVQNDIRQIAAAGGGGLEFLGFYNYGLGPPVTDWSIYGFGTEAFNRLFHAALEESAARGLTLDFAFGPNQGAGVPSVVETPGLAKELVYGNTTIQSGATFSDKIPGPQLNFNQVPGFMNQLEPWGSNELVAVVAGKIAAKGPSVPSIYGPYFGDILILDEKSLIDLTNITDKGSLTWTAPEGNGTWVIWAVYERYTNQRSCVSVGNATTALGNGSWIVDHWSATGAKKITDFWDENILSDASIAALVKKIGGYAWEDSMEMQAALPWTPDLFSRFEKRHGYSIVPYLPLLFHPTNQWDAVLPPYLNTYTLGEWDPDGGPYVQDYKTVLSEGYLDYIDHFNEWAASKGIKYSNQPAYNFPVDMTDAVSHLQVPELESLGFQENIDLYRQFTGAAHLAGQNIISTEIGAVLGLAYKMRVPSLKALFDGSYAAGVNTMVVHGYAYGGEYSNTTWPGYTPFQYEYSEMWNFRQPAWHHLGDLFTYSARNSILMRSGVPKMDVAFYYHEVPYDFSHFFSESDMNKHGYTLEYLGPTNLASKDAVVKDGVLAPDGPAFNALVIYNQTYITLDASAALLRFAQNKLPIYIVGPVPNTTVGNTGQQQVLENIKELLTHNVVHVVDSNSFSGATLAANGVHPRARIDIAANASQLYTFWTSDSESHSEYVYLYNQGADIVFNVTFSIGADLAPYVFDAWTGSQLPLTVFERNSNTIRTEVALRANQTTIIAFTPTSHASGKEHVVSHSSNVHRVVCTANEGLEAWVSDNSSARVTLSNGRNIALPAGSMPHSAVTTLTSWNLTIESYGPVLGSVSVTPNITTIDVGTLSHLAPWTQIPGVEHASGIGTYRTSFSLSTTNATAFLLNFGRVLNTMKAWMNGKQVPAIDPTDSVVDVSRLVVHGWNDLEVQVTTSLFNAVKANIGHIFSIGTGPNTSVYYTGASWEEFGLVGPVELRSFRRVTLI